MILNLNLRPASRHLGDFYRSNDLLISERRDGVLSGISTPSIQKFPLVGKSP